MKITGTNEQEAIWEAIETTDEHIFVNAGAGTGKTFTIVEAANRLPFGSSAAFLAFNKSIADELQERLPTDVEAKTFHSFGFAAIRKAGIKTKYNSYKLNNIIKELLGRDFWVAPVKKLVSLVKGSLVDGTDKKALLSLIEEYNINFNSDRELMLTLEAIPAILTMCRTQTHLVDFDDMIWLPLVNNYPLPKYNVMFVDEAQDFNESQRELIRRCVIGGRCVIVGDKNQAIYGFRGADSNSIGLFYKSLTSGDRKISEFPLSISWRCPNLVVKEANRFVKEFNAHEDAVDGAVIVNAPFTPQEGDMVLCRFNAPIIGAFYDLISQGKSAYILGRDMTKGLTMAIDKITKNGEMGTEEFWELFMIDFEVNTKRLLADNKQSQAIALEDKKDCISIFVGKATTVAGIKMAIDKLFNNSEKGDIMLSTVHKAKGLEADNVYILATERMPHPMGGKEENNIAYVAITRAKKNLFYCGPKPQLN
mgnify:CR=1 FL=1|tara:strand:+ start:1388 stop:2824 length:1437 start_codon:yes stop_codon:yes gene_type:complete